jgi:hypothetical protein
VSHESSPASLPANTATAALLARLDQAVADSRGAGARFHLVNAGAVQLGDTLAYTTRQGIAAGQVYAHTTTPDTHINLYTTEGDLALPVEHPVLVYRANDQHATCPGPICTGIEVPPPGGEYGEGDQHSEDCTEHLFRAEVVAAALNSTDLTDLTIAAALNVGIAEPTEETAPGLDEKADSLTRVTAVAGPGRRTGPPSQPHPALVTFLSQFGPGTEIGFLLTDELRPGDIFAECALRIHHVEPIGTDQDYEIAYSGSEPDYAERGRSHLVIRPTKQYPSCACPTPAALDQCEGVDEDLFDPTELRQILADMGLTLGTGATAWTDPTDCSVANEPR